MAKVAGRLGPKATIFAYAGVDQGFGIRIYEGLGNVQIIQGHK